MRKSKDKDDRKSKTTNSGKKLNIEKGLVQI